MWHIQYTFVDSNLLDCVSFEKTKSTYMLSVDVKYWCDVFKTINEVNQVVYINKMP